jgi:hypothetical protein
MQNRQLSLILAIALLGALEPAVADDGYVFAANFDIRLITGDVSSQVNNRAMVRDGNTIPVLFQYHRIDMTISGHDDDNFVVSMAVFERTDDAAFAKDDSPYSRIHPDDIVFEGDFSAPTEYRWSSADISISLAIGVSVIQKLSN